MNDLLRQFVDQEATAYVKKLIDDAVSQHDEQPCLEKKIFEFNRFEITLDFSNNLVRIEDVLEVGVEGEVSIGLDDFVKLLHDY